MSRLTNHAMGSLSSPLAVWRMIMVKSMRCASLVAALLFVCNTSIALAQIAPGVQQSAGQTAAITGIVTQSDGTPVAGADVTLRGPALLSTKTDARGAFQFAAVPHGLYSVVVRAVKLGMASRNNIAVNSDISVAVSYGSTTAASALKTIASVTTRSSGAHINVTPASIYSITPSTYAFQGNTTWREMLNNIPGVAAGGSLSAGSTTNTVIPDTPFQPVVISINGALPFESATTLDGMPMSNYTFAVSTGGGVDLSSLPMSLFETADVVRGPGANSPTILDSIGGSLVLHAPGFVQKNSFENSFSNDPYGGYFSNTRFALRIGKLSGIATYGFNNSPGPLAAGPVFGGINTPATVNGNAVASAGFTGYAAASPVWGNCFCVINTSMMARGGFQSTAWDQHNGGIGLAYQVSPNIVAQVFYSGNQNAAYQAQFLEAFNFTPGNSYAGSLSAGTYLARFADSNPTFVPELDTSSITEEKITAYSGRGVFRFAAMQDFSYNAQRIAAARNGMWQLWGTGTYCSNPTCTTTTPFTLNGDVVPVTWNPSDYTFNSRGANNDLLASYETQIAGNSYAGISAVKSGNSATYGFIQHFLSGNALTGTTITSTGGAPNSTETINEYRLHVGSQISDRFSTDGSYYIVNGGYHVQDPTDPTKMRWTDIPFAYSAPRLGMTWRPNPDTAIRGSAGGGFAIAPLFNVIGTNSTTPSCNSATQTCTILLTNTNLRPETSFGWDIGTDLRIKRDTAFSLDVYRTELYGQIFRSTTLVGTDTRTGYPIYSSENQNLGHSRYAGVNFALQHRPQTGTYWSLALGLTRGYVVSVPASIYNIAGRTCNFSTGVGCTNTYIIPGPNFNGKYASPVPYANGSVALGYRWAPKKYVDIQGSYQGNNNSYFAPAFIEWDAHGAYQITRNLGLVLTFRNITGIYGGNYQYLHVDPNNLAPVVAGTLFPLYAIPYGPRSLIMTTDISF